MNPASLPFNSFDSFNSFDTSEDESNAYISGLLSQQSSASSASFVPSATAAYNGFDGLFTVNGALTSAEISFGSCDGLPTDLTWDDYLLITEGLLLEGTPQMFDLSAEITGIDVPVSLQTTIEHPSYLGCGNGGYPNGTNVGGSMVTGGWGTSQQVRQSINGVHAPLALPNTHLKISSSSKTLSPKRPNTPPAPPAPPTTPQPRRREHAPSPAAMPNTDSKNASNTSSETQSPPKRSRSSSPPARPSPKRRKDWRKGPEATFRFVHDERSMPRDFRANPDNHGRFQYTATGRRKYLNGPGAMQERRRRREGNQGADQQGAR